jgi:hypothetical protein
VVEFAAQDRLVYGAEFRSGFGAQLFGEAGAGGGVVVEGFGVAAGGERVRWSVYGVCVIPSCW